MRPLVRVVTASESAARDASAIRSGIPSRALMQRAGGAAAAEIALRYRDRLEQGVTVFAGPGNNGGDAWVVARALTATGVSIRVIEPIPAKTDDARAERALALDALGAEAVASSPTAQVLGTVIVDGLLGTGAAGEPRGEIASCVSAISNAASRDGVVVALDVPTGLDASTGERAALAVDADLTLTFGTIKRGHLVARDTCGAIVVLDIGLGTHATLTDGAPTLLDEQAVATRIPRFAADAHKGTRKKVAIIGGSTGMTGAAMLAARAALRSGAGMVKLVVSQESLAIVQEAEPYALAAAWPRDASEFEREVSDWADAVIVGPGLGRSSASQAMLDLTLTTWTGATLLDADAITLFEGRAPELASRLSGRPAILTPHPVEFARLSGRDVADVLARRFDIGAELADTVGCVVLLKGVPTVVASPRGARIVSATGSPALATAGSGDVLSGIAGTLLAQLGDPFYAAAIGAWIHGRAAERVPATASGDTRGITLEDIIAELRDAWAFDTRPVRYPVLLELPQIAPRQ